MKSQYRKQLKQNNQDIELRKQFSASIRYHNLLIKNKRKTDEAN
jgi:hypothetical protein